MSRQIFGSGGALPENWQPGQDYWIYLPEVFPETSSLNPRGRRTSLFDEGWNYGLPSFPPAPPARPSVQFILIDTYPGGRSPSPPPTTFFEFSRGDESRLSQEDQKQAINKLRKQLYSPHMSNIIRRLGTSKSSDSNGGGASLQDDNGKRCAVCLDDFETKQFVTVTPCNHMFHEECIVPWVKSHGKCPVCRFMLAEQNAPHQRGSGGAATASRRGGSRGIPLRI